MKHIAIIKETINGAEINSVNSRDLHKNLGAKTDYSKWATRLIEKYEFVENEDYLTIVKKDGRIRSTDYIFTIDMAKEVCMVANTDKGRETRKYFISIEKQHNKNALSELSDHKHKIHSLLEYTDKMGDVVTEHDKRIENLEKNRRLESWQEANLLDAKNKKVYELGNNDEKLIKKLHRLVWSKFKKRFNLPRYNELTAGRYEDGLMWLNNVELHEVV